MAFVYNMDLFVFDEVLQVAKMLANDINEAILFMPNEELDTVNVGLKVPSEVTSGLGENGERVRMVSFLYRNMSGLLPETLEEELEL